MAPVVNKWRMRLNARRRRGAASGRALARARPVFPIRRPPEVTAAIPAICGSTSVVSYTLILSPKSHVWLLRAPTGSAWRARRRCARARQCCQRALAPTCMPAQAEAASDGVAQMTPLPGRLEGSATGARGGAGRASIKRRAQSGGCDRLCLQRRRTLSLRYCLTRLLCFCGPYLRHLLQPQPPLRQRWRVKLRAWIQVCARRLSRSHDDGTRIT